MKKNNENSDVYVKLDSSSAHDAKRNIFEITESIIHMQMISEKLKKLHKEEIAGRNNSKKELKAAILGINQMMDRMPKVKIEKPKMEKVEHKVEAVNKEVKETKEAPVQKKERKTLGQELEEIKKKIAGLKK